MIEVEGLTKYYGTHVAVDNVSFRVGKGEILAFLGPNGAGKTTTMRILTCYLPPSAGTARVAGHDILDEPVAVRSCIGYLPENVALYGDLSVSAYLDFVGTLKGLARAERVRRGGTVMEQCGIAEVSSRPIGKLSRGYRQRVGLAQALLGDPQVLILDEPTVGLDPKQIVEIRNLIKSLAGERTIILSTHILPEASLVCQRVVIIDKGVVVTDDTPENLVGDLRRTTSVEVTARGDFEGMRSALESVDAVAAVRRQDTLPDGSVRLVVDANEGADVREAVAERLVSAGFGLLALRPHSLTLEDIFVELTTEEPAGESASGKAVDRGESET